MGKKNRHQWDERYSEFQRAHRKATNTPIAIKNTVLAMLKEGKNFITYNSVRTLESKFISALLEYGLEYNVKEHNDKLREIWASKIS